MNEPLWARLALPVLLGVSAGCAVGPDYVPPATSAPQAWHTALQGGAAAEQMDPQGLASWWTTLNDPTLTSLIERAARNNLDLRKARARVREARASRGISQSGLFPTLDAKASATRSRSSQNGMGDTQDVYANATGFDASWELDLFGGVRRSVEVATATLQANTEDLRNVLVSLLAEVALNYIEARTYQVRLGIAEANLKTHGETVALTTVRFEAGLTTALDVEQATYNRESTRSQVPTLQSGLEESKNRLAVLLGEQPGGVQAELAEHRPVPVTPSEVLVGVPADVLRRRPDVRQAERKLAAQTAQVGVATAELYPKLSLLGSIGLDALTLTNLFSAASQTYSVGPSLSWRLFDAGAVRKKIEVQSALQEQALIQYEATVLTALQEVENALVAYAEEQRRREALRGATQAAERAVALARAQYGAGMVDFRSVLDAERSLLSYQDQLAQSEGAVTANLVRLYKALGGGWTSLSPGETG
ncbi:MAG: efflux transporter outer membrane subunit [candidate division NC10 bacterium]|nr:efflux transporter outer membrane subunit [candidate division NC10 bacterium]